MSRFSDNHIAKPEDDAPSTSLVQKPKVYSTGIGKYIKPDLKNTLKRVNNTESDKTEDNLSVVKIKKKVLTQKPFSDFTKW